MSDVGSEARTDWMARIGRRRTENGDGTILPAPREVRVGPGRGHVTVDWEPVPGAVGYLVLRADDVDGSYPVIDHRGGDVLAVPHPPYADTTCEPGRAYHYAVAAISDVNQPGRRSAPVSAMSTVDSGQDPVVRVEVRADRVTGPVHRPWREIIGSEHLSHLLCTDRTGGRSGRLRKASYRSSTLSFTTASVRPGTTSYGRTWYSRSWTRSVQKIAHRHPSVTGNVISMPLPSSDF